MSLYKNKKDRIIFGVCGGIGKNLNINSLVVRLGFIVGTIFSGSLLFWIYLILAIILPIDEE